jgi:hypothetical protein
MAGYLVHQPLQRPPSHYSLKTVAGCVTRGALRQHPGRAVPLHGRPRHSPSPKSGPNEPPGTCPSPKTVGGTDARPRRPGCHSRGNHTRTASGYHAGPVFGRWTGSAQLNGAQHGMGVCPPAPARPSARFSLARRVDRQPWKTPANNSFIPPNRGSQRRLSPAASIAACFGRTPIGGWTGKTSRPAYPVDRLDLACHVFLQALFRLRAAS